jgi:hypothetical protein
MLSIGPRTHFRWQKLSSPYFGRIAKPIARVSLKKKSGDWQEFWVEVDSGAAISLFNKSDCDLLGYRLQDGWVCELQGVTGHSIHCYVHNIDMKIGEEVIKAKVAFSDSDKHRLLLGRVDVFDSFEIDLRGKTLDTFFGRDL